MSKYFERIKDVKIYCPFCKEEWNGHIKEDDNSDDITCPKCNGKIEITHISNVYEVPA